MKLFLYPYGPSNGCAALADRVGAKRIKRQGSKFRPGYDRLVINWGSTRPSVANPNWLNSPAAVDNAGHKYKALARMYRAGVPILEFTRDYHEAKEWLHEGEVVVVRHKMRGHSGEGIEIVEDVAKLPDADLYTKYFKAKEEYRVHVLDGKVIDIQQKRKRADIPAEECNYKVRSHANGFNFCREGVELPDCCADASIRAVAALDLDFGAVDIRYNAKTKRCAVMEVNTAPGLEGTTLDKYADAFTELLQKFMV